MVLIVSNIPISFAEASLTPRNWYGFTYPSQLTYDATVWGAAIEKGSKWGFTVYRVPFLFSNYDLDKLDAIIGLIGSYGGKVILDFHCLEQYTSEPDLVGSPNWVPNWMIIANHYSSSGVVIGYELCNEPTLKCRYADYASNSSLADLLYSTALGIHNINPNKYIVFPPQLHISDYSESLKGLNSVLAIHPYSYGSKSTWEDLKAIADYRFNTQISGWDNVFDYCWCGEIECHPPDNGGATTLELEMQYVSYVINQSISKGFGFCYWKYNYLVDDGGANPDLVISESGFYPNSITVSDKPYVSGIRIYDIQGNLLNLKGWNIKPVYSEEDFQWLKTNGYNAVRVVVFWGEIEKTQGTYDWTALDKTLNWCAKNGLWAWVDNHQYEYSSYFTGGAEFPSWLVSTGGYSSDEAGQQAFSDDFFLKRGYGATSWDEFTKYYSAMVEHCKAQSYFSNIIFWEILNEPMVGATHENSARIACNDRYTEMINLIRGIDPTTIIVLHYIDKGYNERQDFANIVWTKSAYSEYGVGNTDASVTNYFNNRKAEFNTNMNVPYIISETGVTPTTSQSDADSFLTLLTSKQDEIMGSGQDSYFFWRYAKAESEGGYKPPRNADGSPSWLQGIISGITTTTITSSTTVLYTSVTKTLTTSVIKMTTSAMDTTIYVDKKTDSTLSNKPINPIDQKPVPDSTPSTPSTTLVNLSGTINVMIDIIPIFGICMLFGAVSGRMNIRVFLGFVITIVILAVISNAIF